jgi:Effector-associated domain 11
MNLVSKIELFDFIAQGKTRHVIKLLLTITKALSDSDLKHEIIIVSNKYETLSKEQRLGTISNENFHISNAKVNNTLFQIIEKLPNQKFEVQSRLIINTPKIKIGHYIIAIIVLVLTITMGISFFDTIKTSGDNSPAVKGENIHIEYGADWDSKEESMQQVDTTKNNNNDQ